jgi:hypothetical protein
LVVLSNDAAMIGLSHRDFMEACIVAGKIGVLGLAGSRIDAEQA